MNLIKKLLCISLILGTFCAHADGLLCSMYKSMPFGNKSAQKSPNSKTSYWTMGGIAAGVTGLGIFGWLGWKKYSAHKARKQAKQDAELVLKEKLMIAGLKDGLIKSLEEINKQAQSDEVMRIITEKCRERIQQGNLPNNMEPKDIDETRLTQNLASLIQDHIDSRTKPIIEAALKETSKHRLNKFFGEQIPESLTK